MVVWWRANFTVSAWAVTVMLWGVKLLVLLWFWARLVVEEDSHPRTPDDQEVVSPWLTTRIPPALQGLIEPNSCQLSLLLFSWATYSIHGTSPIASVSSVGALSLSIGWLFTHRLQFPCIRRACRWRNMIRVLEFSHSEIR